MKTKIFFVLCFIFSILLLVGCGNVSDEKNNSDNTNSLEGAWVYFPPVRDVFEMAKNVYEAELVELKENKYEYSQYTTADFQGNFKIKVRIKFVYKGDLLPGEDIVEDTVLFHYPDCINVGSTYLFMTGIDEDYIESDKNKLNNKLNLYNFSKFHAIEILGDGKFNAVLTKSGYTGSKKYSTYYEILYDMLNLEVVGDIYSFYFRNYSESKGEYDITLKEMCEFADNVYIGEVIEIQEHGKSEIILEENQGWGKCEISKIEVKVLSVNKGDYVPGQIIQDIIPLSEYPVEENAKNLLCISGDDFFAYYEEMLSGEKSMKDVTIMCSSS